MKIIFSRKGFDSSVGRVASPILPSGQLCSLPIPAAEDENVPRYRDILFDGQPLGKLLCNLTGDERWPARPAHLDPDINSASVPRLPGWRGAFGQAGAAERHLQNQHVEVGDIFLFYGWFKPVECSGAMYRYIPGAPEAANWWKERGLPHLRARDALAASSSCSARQDTRLAL